MRHRSVDPLLLFCYEQTYGCQEMYPSVHFALDSQIAESSQHRFGSSCVNTTGECSPVAGTGAHIAQGAADTQQVKDTC